MLLDLLAWAVLISTAVVLAAASVAIVWVLGDSPGEVWRAVTSPWYWPLVLGALAIAAAFARLHR